MIDKELGPLLLDLGFLIIIHTMASLFRSGLKPVNSFNVSLSIGMYVSLKMKIFTIINKGL